MGGDAYLPMSPMASAAPVTSRLPSLIPMPGGVLVGNGMTGDSARASLDGRYDTRVSLGSAGLEDGCVGQIGPAWHGEGITCLCIECGCFAFLLPCFAYCFQPVPLLTD